MMGLRDDCTLHARSQMVAAFCSCTHIHGLFNLTKGGLLQRVSICRTAASTCGDVLRFFAGAGLPAADPRHGDAAAGGPASGDGTAAIAQTGAAVPDGIAAAPEADDQPAAGILPAPDAVALTVCR